MPARPAEASFASPVLNRLKSCQGMQLDEYRKLAEVQDRMWYFHTLNRRYTQWLPRIIPTDPARLLDAGCGTGSLTQLLQATVPEWNITGLDFSPLACELARALTGVEVVQGSITAMPFADESFDAVLACDVLSQVDDDSQAVRECVRCVRPGGPVIANVPAYTWLKSYHDVATETKHRYTKVRLTDMFRAAGLEVVFATYVNFLPLPLLIARRKLFKPANLTSDVHLYPAPLDAAFRALGWLERQWIGRGWPLPAGSSVFVVGRKPPGCNSVLTAAEKSQQCVVPTP
ncbi:MAG: class I SAM-dependent methyltransferase [Lacunisphaera sp.]|nr:class I SAM-dependent methyltransferase [Lacunisphaera sp.]